ncbi:MAG TPA: transglycosylase SLT domain-containing protein [Gemmatimonadaceae bacterium]
MRVRHFLTGTILLAGCYSHPETTPHPRSVIVAGAPRRVASDSGRSTSTTPAAPAPAATASSGTKSSTDAGATAVSTTDVAKRAIDVFGDSLVDAPAAKRDSIEEPTWDMDVRSYETQERVAHYVSMFTGRAKDRITERLQRGTRYEPMIRAKMKAGGLPEDMYYLALVESGFDPHAYSRAAAVGMWQFMTSTARDMGLRVDRWVDERRDPVRSTGAAVRFIRGLREEFGSLYLAAAAYNGGPGRVSRGLARYADDLEGTPGDDAFFVLAEKDYLRNETREYVPQLIAAALIAKEPSRYGMALHALPPFAYDSVSVHGGTPIAAIAKAAHASTRDLLDLNPQLLRGMTPPRENFQVRVPVGTAAGFDSAFAALSDDELRTTVGLETKKGQTAAGLAEAHGISVAAFKAFNPNLERLKSGRLAPGQYVVFPTPAVASASLDIPDPSIEKFPHSAGRVRVHTVRRGETMRSIAAQYNTSTERLMRINGLRKPRIFPGQTLLLTRASSSSSAKSSKSSKASGSSKSSKTSKSSKKRSGASSKASARTK